MRRSSRDPPLGAETPPTSTIEIDVISADTDGTGWREGSALVRSGRSSDTLDAPPEPPRPFSAATYNMPLSSKRSARIS